MRQRGKADRKADHHEGRRSRREFRARDQRQHLGCERGERKNGSDAVDRNRVERMSQHTRKILTTADGSQRERGHHQAAEHERQRGRELEELGRDPIQPYCRGRLKQRQDQ